MHEEGDEEEEEEEEDMPRRTGRRRGASPQRVQDATRTLDVDSSSVRSCSDPGLDPISPLNSILSYLPASRSQGSLWPHRSSPSESATASPRQLKAHFSHSSSSTKFILYFPAHAVGHSKTQIARMPSQESQDIEQATATIAYCPLLTPPSHLLLILSFT